MRRAGWSLLSLPAALLPTFGCAEPEPAPGGWPLGREDLRGIVIVQVDTLRLDRLALYGAPRATTPLLDARPWFSLRGVRATASWTFPSTASLLTSLEPAHSGLDDVPLETAVPPPLPATWAGLLRREGWATGLYTGNPYLVGSGLEADFSEAVLRGKAETGQANLAALAVDALAWLDRLPEGQPFLLHLQPMDMHAPYAPPADDLAALRADPLPFPLPDDGTWEISTFEEAWAAAATDEARAEVNRGVDDLYDAQLPGLDRSIDALLGGLTDRGLLDRTLVIVTSDHGESLNAAGDGRFEHGYEWREELVNVPFFALLPEAARSLQLDCVASVVDLWPTLAAANGLPVLDGIDGIDLAAGCRTVARGSLWEDTGPPLRWVGVGDLDGAVQRGCATGEEGGTEAGPTAGTAADPTETTPVESLPGGAAYREALDDALDDIGVWRPTVTCEPAKG